MASELYEPNCWDLKFKEIGSCVHISISNTDITSLSLQQYLQLIRVIVLKLRPNSYIQFYAKFYNLDGDFDIYLLRLSERGNLTLVDYPPVRYARIFGAKELDS